MPNVQKLICNQISQDNNNWIIMLRVVFVILLLLIFSTAIAVVQQTQEHHLNSSKLRNKNLEYNQLRIEYQRLLIEQQSFSSTPQVAQRAINQLGMFFPVGKNRLIIDPTMTKTNKKNQGE